MQANKGYKTLAAVDLGSNSFHMIIARLRDGHFQVVDKLREMVQLRRGLDEDNYLSASAQERAINCLQRFGERIKNLPIDNIRVVGTNTLRIAQNSAQFLQQAQSKLGKDIEIITGEEEARLIYLGVAHSLAFDDLPRLVIDIGGGSTEFIIGEGFNTIMRESLEMGCVSFSQRFFTSGKVTKDKVNKALIAAGTHLRAIQRGYRKQGWSAVVGASGTIRTVANITSDNGIISRKSLDKLIDDMVKDRFKQSGLSKERLAVLPGGVVILKAIFDRLKITQMVVADGALREGLLYDLLGRIQHNDERDRTVSALASRYQIDEEHAQRVSIMAVKLFEQVASFWKIDNEYYLERLKWAAKLREIGLTIAHHKFHKHSEYLVAHSNLPGFSRKEQYILATIIGGQRKKFPKREINELTSDEKKSTQYLLILLRLATVFNRGRSEKTARFVKLKASKNKLLLKLPKDWLVKHPLTKTDLLQEANYLQAIDFNLEICI